MVEGFEMGNLRVKSETLLEIPSIIHHKHASCLELLSSPKAEKVGPTMKAEKKVPF